MESRYECYGTARCEILRRFRGFVAASSKHRKSSVAYREYTAVIKIY